VVAIYAVTQGLMDKVPVERVPEFEKGLVEYMRSRHGALLNEMLSTGKLPEGEALKDAIKSFADSFAADE
jgi:F-type H+-transporting ATPase subunit alpha